MIIFSLEHWILILWLAFYCWKKLFSKDIETLVWRKMQWFFLVLSAQCKPSLKKGILNKLISKISRIRIMQCCQLNLFYQCRQHWICQKRWMNCRKNQSNIYLLLNVPRKLLNQIFLIRRVNTFCERFLPPCLSDFITAICNAIYQSDSSKRGKKLRLSKCCSFFCPLKDFLESNWLSVEFA